jgi:hypothetical protein
VVNSISEQSPRVNQSIAKTFAYNVDILKEFLSTIPAEQTFDYTEVINHVIVSQGFRALLWKINSKLLNF